MYPPNNSQKAATKGVTKMENIPKYMSVSFRAYPSIVMKIPNVVKGRQDLRKCSHRKMSANTMALWWI